MEERPRFKTRRLLLRPFVLEDAPEVQRLAGDHDIAATTLTIPHPYEDGMAEEWIKSHLGQFKEGKLVNFAIVLRETNGLVGAIGLNIRNEHESAELGYWVGKPYWGNGYCTEAATAVIGFAFDRLKLNRVFAEHFAENSASGRVMEKAGMKYEGYLRQVVKKWGKFRDLKMYSILKSEYKSTE